VLFGVAMLAGAAWLLRRELHSYRFSEIVAALGALPLWRLAASFIATVLGYLALIGHDLIALEHLRRKVPLRRVVLAGFVTYAFSNSAPVSVVVAGGIRHRFYSRWGVDASDTKRVMGLTTTTYALGLLFATSVAMTLGRFPIPGSLHLPFSDSFTLGVFAGLVLAGYLAWTMARGKVLGARHREGVGPTLGFSATQIAISLADWLLSGWALYVLLTQDLSFALFFGVFMIGQIAALLGQTPGGLGVFDAVMIWGLAPAVSPPTTLAALFAYRIVYHLLPLLLAAGLFVAHEGRLLLRRRR
jgi:uncharacterized membrane protein YbhN (UPF0104 family)